jgi:hypothetical protein
MEFDGFQEDMYEAVRDKIDWPQKWPEGIDLHVAGPSESGMRLVEVWNSRAEYDQWMSETIDPVLQELFGDAMATAPPPRITEFTVNRQESRSAH